VSAIQQVISSYGGASGGDPYYAYVVSLLHFDGTNGSTTATDEKGKTWTAGGNAQLTTTSPCFGTAAALFDGTGDWFYTADHADFALGTNDFTIEFQLNRNIGSALKFFCGQCDSAGSATSTSFLFYNLATTQYLAAYLYSGSTQIGPLSGTTAITTGTYHHVALTRSGNDFRLFLDGTQQGSTVTSSLSINDSTNTLSIGRTGELTSSTTDGRIDEFRFTNGIARYTSNFTPPTSAFPNY
jgi:hypothetical protein